VYNALGQVMLESASAAIDVSHLTSGLYFISTKLGQKLYQNKFLKL
jgi:hypothetical protein